MDEGLRRIAWKAKTKNIDKVFPIPTYMMWSVSSVLMGNKTVVKANSKYFRVKVSWSNIFEAFIKAKAD